MLASLDADGLVQAMSHAKKLVAPFSSRDREAVLTYVDVTDAAWHSLEVGLRQVADYVD